MNMTRNQAFSEAVYEVLRQAGPLLTMDIYPLVQRRMPDWCVGNWKHDLRNAQRFLKNQGLIVSEPVLGSGNIHIWKATP